MTSKNCTNCAHRIGSFRWGKCMKTGYYIETQRKHPFGGCDVDFSGWEPRQSIFVRITEIFVGVKQ